MAGHTDLNTYRSTARRCRAPARPQWPVQRAVGPRPRCEILDRRAPLGIAFPDGEREHVASVSIGQHARARERVGVRQKSRPDTGQHIGLAGAEQVEGRVGGVGIDRHRSLELASQRGVHGVMAHERDPHSGAVGVGDGACGRMLRHEIGEVGGKQRRREVDLGGAGRIDAKQSQVRRAFTERGQHGRRRRVFGRHKPDAQVFRQRASDLDADPVQRSARAVLAVEE